MKKLLVLSVLAILSFNVLAVNDVNKISVHNNTEDALTVRIKVRLTDVQGNTYQGSTHCELPEYQTSKIELTRFGRHIRCGYATSAHKPRKSKEIGRTEYTFNDPKAIKSIEVLKIKASNKDKSLKGRLKAKAEPKLSDPNLLFIVVDEDSASKNGLGFIFPPADPKFHNENSSFMQNFKTSVRDTLNNIAANSSTN